MCGYSCRGCLATCFTLNLRIEPPRHGDTEKTNETLRDSVSPWLGTPGELAFCPVRATIVADPVDGSAIYVKSGPTIPKD